MANSGSSWALNQLRRGATAPVFGWRSQPERVVLAPHPGVEESDAPPVRIFVGTEPGQDRIERVLVWSIERVRNPARTYEIYFMKELAGFDQRRWLTGFTNYRFAIPYLAGGTGRAIYNDCDQVYLTDPAELFDMDMKGAGFMSINDHDTSVMLIDCDRMISVWTLDDARFGKRKQIEEKARAQNLWGGIDPHWNARDEEYRRGISKCVHFTTIHTQPWMPFPERFVYQRNPIEELFHELEDSADAAGFQVFSEENPSAEYRALIAQIQIARSYERNGGAAILPDSSVARQTKSETANGESTLEFSFVAAPLPSNGTGHPTARLDPAVPQNGRIGEKQFDTVVCRSGLEFFPSQDVPWLLDSLFRRARKELRATVRIAPTVARLPGGTSLMSRPRGTVWWRDRFERIGERHPHIRWHVDFLTENSTLNADGGRLTESPRVWVLADDKTGHNVQSIGLAEALGWPFEVKELRFNPLNRISNLLLGATTATLDAASRATLKAPWPDLVISTGRRSAPIARWIARQNSGGTRLVHLGRKGGERPDEFDLVVSCTHFRLPEHRRRMRLAAPLNTLDPATLEKAKQRWLREFENSPHPWVTLVVGGPTAEFDFTAADATRLAREVRAAAEAVGGRVFAITSPRTGADAVQALADVLEPQHHLHRWQKGEADNPYFGYLALADVLVVTGESESMLSEACTIGAPVYIYPMRSKATGLRRRLREWVTATAYSRPRKKNKGSVRPQQGLEKFCSQLIAWGIVRPPRDLASLHAALVEAGAAHMFGAETLRTERHSGLREIGEVADRVRKLFGLPVTAKGDS